MQFDKKMETTVLERIRIFLGKNKLTDNQFAKAINVPQTTISGMFVRGGDPKVSLINSIIDAFPELNVEWLLSGKGEMMKGDESTASEDREEKISMNQLLQIIRNFQLDIAKRDVEIERLKKELDELKNKGSNGNGTK